MLRYVLFVKLIKHSARTGLLLALGCILWASKLPLSPKPQILFLHYPTQQITGIGVYLINCSKLLRERGYTPYFLVIKNSQFQKELEKNTLPFDTVPLSSYNNIRALTSIIHKTCAEHHSDVICCNWYDHSLAAAQAVARDRSLKVIFIDHMNIAAMANQETHKLLNSLDGILGVNPLIVSTLADRQVNAPTIAFIPPFFDEDRFLNFSLSDRYRRLNLHQARVLFFRETFGIALQKLPVICMIANMYEDRTKNHQLLFQAIHRLIHKNKPVEVMLAGDGAMRPKLEQLADLLKIKKYVHFLGFTDRIPELLYFTDFHVLSSRHEAFGIVHVEAAFMKKVSVGATNTGAPAIIKDGITGLIFENDNAEDLARKIEFLIDHPALCHEMGKSAYAHALLNFSNNAKIQAFEKFLCHVTGH